MSIKRRILALLLAVGSVVLPTSAILFTNVDDPAPFPIASGTSTTWEPEVAPGKSVIGNTGPLTSYFFEALITVQGQPESPLTIKGWFEKPGKTRWEIRTATSDYPRTFLIVAGDAWCYDPIANQYSFRQGLVDPELAPGGSQMPDASLTHYGVGFGEGYSVMLLGHYWPRSTDEMLGRQVVVYGAGKPQLWIDPELHAIMRLDIETRLSGGMRVPIQAEIVRLAYNIALDPSVFEFTPPHDSVAVTGFNGKPFGTVPGLRALGEGTYEIGALAQQLAFGSFNVPPGFMAPAYLPSGYSVSSVGMIDAERIKLDARGIRQITRDLKNDGDSGTLSVTEEIRSSGLLPSEMVGTSLHLLEGTAYLSADEHTIFLARGDIVISITTDRLAPEELVRIAESMR